MHNYGAAGAGYQASWQVTSSFRVEELGSDWLSRGMAKHGVRLLCEALDKEQFNIKIVDRYT